MLVSATNYSQYLKFVATLPYEMQKIKISAFLTFCMHTDNKLKCLFNVHKINKLSKTLLLYAVKLH